MKFPFEKNSKISSIFLNYIIVYTVLIMTVVTCFFIYVEITQSENNNKKFRESLLREKKLFVKNQVNKVFNYIEYVKKHYENEQKNELSEKVNQICSTLSVFSKANYKNIPDSIKWDFIKHVVVPSQDSAIKCNLFIVKPNGEEILSNSLFNFRNKSFFQFQDAKGNYIFKKGLDFNRSVDQQFVFGWLVDNMKNKPSKHLLFVKYYKPLDIIVGASSSDDDLIKKEQIKVKNWVTDMQWGKEGYVFVNSYSGKAIIIDSEKYKSGDDISDIVDSRGNKVFQKEFAAVQDSGGAFIQYFWKKKSSTKISEKISFVRGCGQWKWIIGSGVYIDDIAAEIANNKALLYSRVYINLLVFALLLILSILLSYIFAKHISSRIDFNLRTLFSKIKKSVMSGKKLVSDDYTLRDIHELIVPINKIIEHRKRLDTKLRNSEIRFRKIFQYAPVMFVIFDDEYNYKFSNKRFDDLLNLTGNRIITKFTFFRSLPNYSVNRDFLKNVDLFDGEFREIKVETKNGVKTQQWATIKTEFDEVIFVGYDISVIQSQKQELEENNKVKDRIISVISHDLHAPFNSIMGFAKILLLKRNKLSEIKQQQYLQYIITSSQSMHQMMINLLTWLRSQSGKMQKNVTEFNLFDILHDISNVLITQLKIKSLTLNVKCPESIVLNNDETMLKIIIQNLVSNSIKFSVEKSIIEINVIELTDSRVIIEVVDSGIGMDESLIKSVLKQNNVESSPGTDNEKGTGLGLALCVDLVTKIGGTISIESEKGVGTKVSIIV